jgi:hypothetical protein
MAAARRPTLEPGRRLIWIEVAQTTSRCGGGRDCHCRAAIGLFLAIPLPFPALFRSSPTCDACRGNKPGNPGLAVGAGVETKVERKNGTICQREGGEERREGKTRPTRWCPKTPYNPQTTKQRHEPLGLRKWLRDLGASTRSGHGPYAEFDRRETGDHLHFPPPVTSFNTNILLQIGCVVLMRCWPSLHARMPSSGSPLFPVEKRAGGKAGQTEQSSTSQHSATLQRQSTIHQSRRLPAWCVV